MAIKKIGQIVNSYGLKGQLKVSVTSSRAEERFKPESKIMIENKEYTITSMMRKNDKIYIISLEGFDDINNIESFIGKEILADVKPLDGSYFYDDLVGATIIGKDGEILGQVETVTKMPASDYLVFNNHYIPFKEDIFISKVDLEEKKIYLTDLATETLK